MAGPESIQSIAATIKLNIDSLGPSDKDNVQRVIIAGITTVECLLYLSRNTDCRNTPLLELLADEIFVDFHMCLMLAGASQHKPGLVLLRVCAETALYSLYFIDHPVEAAMWAAQSRDASFTTTLTELEIPMYFTAAGGEGIPLKTLNQAISQLRTNYRTLSERVHGKFAPAPYPETLDGFVRIAQTTMGSLSKLCLARAQSKLAMIAEIPALDGLMQ